MRPFSYVTRAGTSTSLTSRINGKTTHTHTQQALARPPRTPWEEASAKSPNPRKYDNEGSYGKVQGSAGEGRHGICGMPGGLAIKHDGGPPVEGNLRQPGVA